MKGLGLGGDGGAEGFGPCPLACWCASSSQCKGLELLLDGIFSPVACRRPSIHLEGCRLHSGEPATKRHSHKEQPVGQPMPLI